MSPLRFTAKIGSRLCVRAGESTPGGRDAVSKVSEESQWQILCLELTYREVVRLEDKLDPGFECQRKVAGRYWHVEVMAP